MISAVICVSLRKVWHLSSVTCHVSMSLFRLISIAEYAFKICFEVATYLPSRDKIWNLPWTFCLLYLHSNSILWRRARLLLELFASTIGWFLSRIKYLPSYVSLWRCPTQLLKTEKCSGKCATWFVSCLSISNKNLDVLSSTCFLSKFWYLRVACTI